ncbi:hypothetical protein ACHAWF_003847 [Thalassiosira exigua]
MGPIFWTTRQQSSDLLELEAPPLNNVSAFMVKFQDILLNDEGLGRFVPLVLEDGKLLCRRKHRQKLSAFEHRSRFFAQMVTKGPKLQKIRPYNLSLSLPVMFMESDDNGCNIQAKTNQYNWPRLHWSQLAPDRGDYCVGVIGVPSYETWKFYQLSERGWENYFKKNGEQYPWSKKTAKAGWRGATTYEGSQYSNSELGETPRGKLVNISSKRPDLMDAAFHKVVQNFRSQRKELKQQFTVSKRISPRDMMNFKARPFSHAFRPPLLSLLPTMDEAIIDIDGNNWSSRFGLLLCSNSVVIKIDPDQPTASDFIEYFYDREGAVKPNVHYIPASLDNLTEVVEYIMDDKNEAEMNGIVKSANSWCKEALSKEGFARESFRQLEMYQKALDHYDGNWAEEWKAVRQRFASIMDDLEYCNTWSFADPFTFPRFSGL